jgi:hypothetical protein
MKEKKNMKSNNYFIHTDNLSRYEGLLTLRLKRGFEGLGMFYQLLERFASNNNKKLRLDYIDTLTLDMNLELDYINEFINDCLEFGLLTKDDEYIWSDLVVFEL